MDEHPIEIPAEVAEVTPLERIEKKIDKLIEGQKRLEKKFAQLNAELGPPPGMVIDGLDFLLKNVN